MKLLLQLSGDDSLTSYEAALLEVTAELKTLLLQRLEDFTLLKKRDKDLNEIEYWDMNPAWFNEIPDTLYEEVCADKIVDVSEGTQYAGLVEATRWKELLLDAPRCRVDEQGVYWIAFLRHSDIKVETTLVSWRLIEDA